MPLPATNNVVSVTNTYTARVNDTVILCDMTIGGYQVTLPAPATVPGKQFMILKTDATANAITIAGASGNINGSASKNTSTQYDGWTVVSDGSNYFILK